jgi:hypothetical protein
VILLAVWARLKMGKKNAGPAKDGQSSDMEKKNLFLQVIEIPDYKQRSSSTLAKL